MFERNELINVPMRNENRRLNVDARYSPERIELVDATSPSRRAAESTREAASPA